MDFFNQYKNQLINRAKKKGLYENMDFFNQYEKWQNDCIDELKEMSLPWDIDPDNVDICEDGKVYFGNMHITHAGFVTRWFESEHFVE